MSEFQWSHTTPVYLRMSGGTVICSLLHQSSVFFFWGGAFVLFRFSQTQSQPGRQGDQALTSVSSSRTTLQRSLQHTERKARTACHQRQVQGPDRGGGGEGFFLLHRWFHYLLQGYKHRLLCFCCFDALLQESERYAYEWQRCLENALEVCGCFVSVFVRLTL